MWNRKKYKDIKIKNIKDITKPLKELASKLKELNPESSIQEEHDLMLATFEEYIASFKDEKYTGNSSILFELERVSKRLDLEFKCN